MLVRNQVSVGLTRSTINPVLPVNSQLKVQVNNVRIAVSPLWRGQGIIHGFVKDKDMLLLKH